MGKKKPLLKTVPFEFVIDALAKADPRTRAMFGCTAVYGDRITFILRDRADSVADNGVWFATTGEHRESCAGIFRRCARSGFSRSRRIRDWMAGFAGGR